MWNFLWLLCTCWGEKRKTTFCIKFTSDYVNGTFLCIRSFEKHQQVKKVYLNKTLSSNRNMAASLKFSNGASQTSKTFLQIHYITSGESQTQRIRTNTSHQLWCTAVLKCEAICLHAPARPKVGHATRRWSRAEYQVWNQIKWLKSCGGTLTEFGVSEYLQTTAKMFDLLR